MTRLIAILLFLGSPALAENPEDFGTLNPDEMTWQSIRDRAESGETGMVLCSTGYMMTKSGDHATARLLFKNCADAGYTRAMTWMSQLDNNGLGGRYDTTSRVVSIIVFGIRPGRGYRHALANAASCLPPLGPHRDSGRC